MTTFMQELRVGLRRLRKNDGFCSVAVLALGGVGAGIAVSPALPHDLNRALFGTIANEASTYSVTSPGTGPCVAGGMLCSCGPQRSIPSWR
ncbi:MAG TPA: hypothetical protein VFD30_16695 [Terriglobia bacterium]|nr:hypothetical protein [Terriglobia bacterium]